MDTKSIYKPSEDVVVRDVQGEFIIVPVTSGIGDLDEAIYSLNETGRAIWERMDGKKNLDDISEELSSEFDGSKEEIEKDVLGIVKELVKNKMLIKVN